jgi:hypothetical protein
LARIIRFLVNAQRVFHLFDVFRGQLGHAPHFFPATASTRGSGAKPGLFRGPPWAPVCA